MRKWIVAAVAAAALGGAAAGAAVFNVPVIAGAQSTSTAAPATPPASPPWMTDALKKLVDAGTINQSQADAVSQALVAARPQGGPQGPGRPGPSGGAEIAVAAKAIGIDEAALRDALKSGKTIAQVAQDHGVDPQKVIDAMVADLKTHLDADVAAGRITQAQEDQRLADAKTHITDLVNGKLPALGGHPGFGPGPRPGGPNLAAAAKAIGIDEAALRDALKSGKTIAQVAQDHGVDPQKVIDAMVADLKTQLDAGVAAGRITQAQEDQRLVDAPAHISDLVNGKLPPRGPFGPGGPGGFGGFGPNNSPPTTTG